MNQTFERFYRQLGYATGGALVLALVLFVLSLLSALIGFPQAVASFNGATWAVTYVFLALLAIFLITSIVAAFVRWLDRRNRPANQSA